MMQCVRQYHEWLKTFLYLIKTLRKQARCITGTFTGTMYYRNLYRHDVLLEPLQARCITGTFTGTTHYSNLKSHDVLQEPLQARCIIGTFTGTMYYRNFYRHGVLQELLQARCITRTFTGLLWNFKFSINSGNLSNTTQFKTSKYDDLKVLK